MKPSKALLPFLTAIAVSSLPLHAATINLDLSSNNSGNITLNAGSNDFSFTGLSVDYLIVGGGGGGGSTRNNTSRAGGGGGAGGLLQGTTSIAGVQSISVGSGGTGGVGGSGSGGAIGGDSSAFSLTAIGGGGGGNNVSAATATSGGSGGGLGSTFTTPLATGTVGQGNSGGAGNGSGIGGGGGGAGGAGAVQTGGAGLSSTITGSSVTYAAGGNGGNSASPVPATPAAAAANSGNGGLGVAVNPSNSKNGGDGASGVIVVRYTGPQVLTGGLVSTVGGDTVHQFTTTGTNTLGFNATIAGDIDGAGDLDWNGQGTLTLTGNNIYTGTTTISSGSLLVQGTIARTADLLFSGNGQLNLGSTGSIFVLASNYSIGDADIDILAGLISGVDTLQVTTFNDGFNDFTQISVIPEPTTALLGGLGMLFLLRRRRA